MTATTVSVIVPVYNGAAFLGQALESVVGQTRPPDEVIVVDDGSTDSSKEVVEGFPWAMRYLGTKNRGPAAARNLGIATSKGALLAFIDQDDIWHRSKLEQQVACLEEDPTLDLCYALVDLFWEAPVSSEEQSLRSHPRTRNVPGYALPAAVIRRSAFDRVGPLNTTLRFGDGTEWAMRAIDAGLRSKLLPEVLLYHRMHNSNLTRQRDCSEREFLDILRQRIWRLRQAGRQQGA